MRRLGHHWVRYWAVLAVAVALVTTAAAAEPERHRCEECGMFWDRSSTRMEATVKRGGDKGTHRFESAGCLYRWLRLPEQQGAELQKLSVLDYTTFGTKEEKMLDGLTATWLFDTKPLSGSMAPFSAAFANEHNAKVAQKSIQGKVQSWEKLQESLERAQRKADKQKEGKN